MVVVVVAAAVVSVSVVAVAVVSVAVVSVAVVSVAVAVALGAGLAWRAVELCARGFAVMPVLRLWTCVKRAARARSTI
ncbi:MAG TPA: hypothetical protein VFU02_16260, partial [Polyangiaceae bacterium]|nr:hypothetical protein [Polyangiaceae bacterium]